MLEAGDVNLNLNFKNLRVGITANIVFLIIEVIYQIK